MIARQGEASLGGGGGGCRGSGGFAGGAGTRSDRTGRLVLIRHGQSTWNVTDPSRGLTARFTGWCDVPLTEKGVEQASAAGRALATYLGGGGGESAEEGGARSVGGGGVDCAFTSLLSRASDTLTLTLRELGLIVEGSDGDSPSFAASSSSPPQCRIPVVSSWRLNERHYGALVGLSKEGAERLYGRERLSTWRDSWDVPPPPMGPNMVERWSREGHCGAVTIVRDPGGGRLRGDSGGTTAVADSLDRLRGGAGTARTESSMTTEQGGFPVLGRPVDGSEGGMAPTAREFAMWEKNEAVAVAVDPPSRGNPSMMPPSESLRDASERVLPLWIRGIAPRLRNGETVLVVAHANTIRAMLHRIDPCVVTRENMKSVKIPSAVPLVYEFRAVEEEEEKGGEGGGHCCRHGWPSGRSPRGVSRHTSVAEDE